MNKIDSTIYEEAKNASYLAGGGCGTCQRKGTPFFLVRQSVIKRNMSNIEWSKGIPALSGRKPSKELTQHEYSLRMLREGYVYVLFDRAGERKLMGYEVTSKGALRHRSIKHMKEFEIEKLAESCTHYHHYLPAIFANIDVMNDTVWIAYSRRAWSKKTEDYYRTVGSNLERFTKVVINDESRQDPSKLTKGNSFDFADLLDEKKSPNLPEFIYEKETLMSQFPTAHDFYSYADNEKIKELNRVVNKLQRDNKCKIGCVVLEDTFGIAEELNAQRLINCDPIITSILRQEEKMGHEMSTAYKDKIANFTLSKEWFGDQDQPSPTVPYLEQYVHQSLGIDPVNTPIINKKLLFSSANGLSNPIRVHPYFDSERIYKRKIISCIESYAKGLKSHYREKNKGMESKYIDLYQPCSNFNGALSRYNLNISSLYRDGWNEVILSNEEKQVLLTKHQSAIPANDVRRFALTVEDIEKRSFKWEWKKLEERLDRDKLNDFQQEDKQLFDDLIKKIRVNSDDYFLFVTWLFGNKDKSSAYAPEGITEYNTVEFWKYELENDYSKDHAGFIQDVTSILQGNIQLAKLPEQFGLWDSLFRDESSVYFYVLKGQENGIYNWLLKARMESMDQDIKEVKSWQEFIDKFNVVMDLPLSKNGTTVFVSAIEELINWGTAGIANKPDSARLINEVLMKDHFVENLKIFSGIEFRRISLPIKLKNVPLVYKTLMKYSDVSSVSIKSANKSYQLSAVSGSEQWQFESELTKKQLNKIVQMEFMIVADDIAAMEELLTTLKNSGNLKETTLAKTSHVLGAEIKIAHQFSGELILDDLEKAIATTKNRIRIESTKAVMVNSLMIGIQSYFVYQNIQRLNEQGKELRQEIREQIIADIQKTVVVISIMSAEIVTHIIKVIGALPRVNMLTSMVPGCTTFLKGTGAALSVIAIFDGVMSIYKGIGYSTNGDNQDGKLLISGSLFSLGSGIIGLIAALSTITLPLILLSIGFAIMGAILVYYGSESDRWSEMQLWFNRCCFGKQRHKEKGEPYPLTAIGTSQALNDYLVYLSGVYIALNYDDSDHELFNRHIIEHNKNGISRNLYQALYVHLKLPQMTNLSRYTCMIYLVDFHNQHAKIKLQHADNKEQLLLSIEKNNCSSENVMMGKPGQYQIMPKKASEKGRLTETSKTLEISQKIAELFPKVKEAIAILHYWQDDKTDVPLRIEHQIKG